MRIILAFVIILLSLFIYMGCKESGLIEPIAKFDGKIDIAINDVPFQTETFLRIPYTLRFWEFEKEGLKLERIHVLDYYSKKELMKIEKNDIQHFYKDPLPQNPYFISDRLDHYYFSIQLPIPLNQQKPTKIFHKFDFIDTVKNINVTLEGGILIPRINRTPVVINSPVKGNNWVFINQSTLEYHFYVLFFTMGNIYCGERFAFDNMKLNSNYTSIYSGDPKVNSSYFNYGDTLYAVANGKVVYIYDGMQENNGNMHDNIPTKLEELGGNHLILDIGGGLYAFYGHCIPNSFKVKVGDYVTEGQPLTLLGNSGNSDAPHLHFQIADVPNFLLSKGIPFVLKKYTKLGDYDNGQTTPTTIINSMMEEKTVIGF